MRQSFSAIFVLFCFFFFSHHRNRTIGWLVGLLVGWLVGWLVNVLTLDHEGWKTFQIDNPRIQAFLPSMSMWRRCLVDQTQHVLRKDQQAGAFVQRLLKSRWWQLKYFLFSSRKLGKIPILTNIFQMGWFNHQPEILHR